MKEKLLKGTEERLKPAQLFFNELEKLNPERIFFMKITTIKVDTPELWNLKFPEGCEILIGKDEQELEKWGYLAIKNKGLMFRIYSQ